MKQRTFLMSLLMVIFFAACSGGVDSKVLTDQTKQDQSKATNKSFIPDDRFEAKTIDGADFDSASYAGQKLILGFFSSKKESAKSLVKNLQKLKDYEDKYNFKIFLISLEAGKESEVKDFLKEQQVDLPVLMDDANLSLSDVKFAMENDVSLLGLSVKHKPRFGLKKYVFDQMQDGDDVFLDYMKENLLIKSFHGKKPILGLTPQAPDFSVKGVDGKTYSLASLKGKAVLLLFFSPRCPHCQHEMKFLRDKVYPELHSKGLEILALSVLPLQGEVLKLYNSFGFKWPVVDDSKNMVRGKFSKERGVPENFFIDREGKIQYYSEGYSDHKNDIYMMRFKKMLGLPNEPLLSANHYNGVESCQVCHQAEYVSWSVTPHAHAWETLQVKGEDSNPECVSCHSVGFNDAKGYRVFKDKKTGQELAQVAPIFQNVQCENCHGVGGPHITKDAKVSKGDSKEVCLNCHTAKFSLYFNYDERLKRVNHSDKEKIASLSKEERIALLEKVTKTPDEIFGANHKYVGSGECASCHKEIHDNWKKTKHGTAFEDLKKAGHSEDPNCLKCHTVGYGNASGYLSHSTDENFHDVGCESCHGPGEKHVQSKLKTDIRGLGDDCPFCVVEQICYSCHDPENSPGFNIHQGLKKIRELHKYK